MQPRQVRISFGAPWTPVVRTLIIINAVVYVSLLLIGNQIDPTSQMSYRGLAYTLLGVQPEAVLGKFAGWQLITYLFLHDNFLHFLFNMLGLWWFGADVERAIGSRSFLRYYFFTGAGAGLVSAIAGLSTVGASGSIYGLLLAYGLLFPNRVLYLYFVIPVKAKYCVILFGLLEFIALWDAGTRVNNLAHLAGIGFGLVWFLYMVKRTFLFNKFREFQKRRRRRKFRVIHTDPEEQFRGPYDNQNKTIH